MRVHYFAEEAGLSEAQIYATVHGNGDDPAWSPADSVLIRLADELHDTVAISDGLWADLRMFSNEAILQLLMMAGYHRTVAYLANGLRLPLELKVGRPFPAARN